MSTHRFSVGDLVYVATELYSGPARVREFRLAKSGRPVYLLSGPGVHNSYYAEDVLTPLEEHKAALLAGIEHYQRALVDVVVAENRLNPAPATPSVTPMPDGTYTVSGLDEDEIQVLYALVRHTDANSKVDGFARTLRLYRAFRDTLGPYLKYHTRPSTEKPLIEIVKN